MSEENENVLTEEECNKLIEEIMHIERQYANEKKIQDQMNSPKVQKKIDDILTQLPND